MNAPKRAAPWLWVPSLYFAMGTPMIAVSVVSAIMYKNLGLSNAQVALYTGSMYLPWVLKPLWAPVVDMVESKRFFVLAAELAMAVSFACVALSLGLRDYLAASLTFLWITGFASATQDIAGDGVYIASMGAREQARYVGIQGICWNIGRLLASGVLVELTQHLHGEVGLDWSRTWAVVMLLIATLMALSAAWHAHFLPSGRSARAKSGSLGPHAALSTLSEAWVSFFAKKQIVSMLAVVFFYRFGEGFIEKVGPLFLMDTRTVGGLALDNAVLGRINGTYATLGFLAGTMLGGLLVEKLTLKRSFWLLALALNVPHVTYLYLSAAQPGNVSAIAAVVTLEKFGYGFGCVGHMLYMMQQVAPGPYRTAHYAFATGLMGLSMMATGMISGHLQEWLGYQAFFALALAASVPPIVLAWFAPFGQAEGEGEREQKDAARDREPSLVAGH